MTISTFNSYRRLTTAGIGLASVLILSACGERDPHTTPPEIPGDTSSTSGQGVAVADGAREAWDATKETAGNLMDGARDTTTAAWDDVKDATYEERAKFTAAVSRQIERTETKLAEWSAPREGLDADARAAWQAGLRETREAGAVLRAELAKVGAATADTWDEVKESVADAWERLELAYSDQRKRAES